MKAEALCKVQKEKQLPLPEDAVQSFHALEKRFACTRADLLNAFDNMPLFESWWYTGQHFGHPQLGDNEPLVSPLAASPPAVAKPQQPPSHPSSVQGEWMPSFINDKPKHAITGGTKRKGCIHYRYVGCTYVFIKAAPLLPLCGHKRSATLIRAAIEFW
jgi:hypothetical protein